MSLFLLAISCQDEPIGEVSKDSCTNSCVREEEKDLFTRSDHIIVTYRIEGDELSRCFSYSPSDSREDPSVWAQQKTDKARRTHKRNFRLFANMIPSRFREGIRYFSIFDSSPDPIRMGMLDWEKSYGGGYRNVARLAISSHIGGFEEGDLGHGILIYTFIHEFAHYLMSYYNNSSYPYITPFEKFISERKKTLSCERYYKDEKKGLNCTLSRDEFVSEYSKTNIVEDMAETFTHFVLRDPINHGPGIKKIMIFQHDSTLTKIRNEIRANLKRLGIQPYHKFADNGFPIY